jgi:hypothetical protein
MKTKSFLLRTVVAAGLLLASFAVQAQNKLTFCESVGSDGKTSGVYTTFNIPEAGGYLYFHVALNYDVGTDDIGYEIYRLNDDGTETYSTTIFQTTEDDWDTFWSAVTFYNAGRYRVKVIAWYDADDLWGTELASNVLTIVKQ